MAWRRLTARAAKKYEWPVHPGYPEEVQIVPANACNFRCKACPKSVYDTDNRMMPRRVYDRVREQILPHVKMANLQGLGEPTLSPMFMEMLRDARDLGHRVRFVTNASRIDAEMAVELARSPVEMTISIDGAKRETHEDSRPGASFEQLFEALAHMQRESQSSERHPGFVWRVNTVVTTRNIGELEGIMEIAKSHGAVSYMLIAPGVGDRTDAFALDTVTHHQDLLRERYPALQSHADALGLQLIAPSFAISNGDSVVEKSSNSKGNVSHGKSYFPQKCFDPWRTIYIDVDGWVRPCCRAVWVGMGNILSEDFATIWNNHHYRRLRKTVNSNNPPSFCRGCSNNWGINGGDEHYAQKLLARGITLEPPPSVGVEWDPVAKKHVPAK